MFPGYDENDLDLDLFVTEIIHRDLQALSEMWPYEASSSGPLPSGESEIRRVVDAPIDSGDGIGVTEEVYVKDSVLDGRTSR